MGRVMIIQMWYMNIFGSSYPFNLSWVPGSGWKKQLWVPNKLVFSTDCLCRKEFPELAMKRDVCKLASLAKHWTTTCTHAITIFRGCNFDSVNEYCQTDTGGHGSCSFHDLSVSGAGSTTDSRLTIIQPTTQKVWKLASLSHRQPLFSQHELFGMWPTRATRILPEKKKKRCRYPEVQLNLIITNTEQMWRLVVSGYFSGNLVSIRNPTKPELLPCQL